MTYDLLKAFVFSEARKGRHLQLSEPVCHWINERIDKAGSESAEQRAERGIPNQAASSGEAGDDIELSI